MSLSNRTKKIMVVALADKRAGEELAQQVNAGVAGASAANASASAAAGSAIAAAASAVTASNKAAAIDAAATAIPNIADPSSATAEDVANKLNALLTALRAIV